MPDFKKPLISIRGLKKQFGSNEVLKNIDLDIHEGEVVVVIGPSGCGKSTLLRCINMLEKATSGTIEINGEILSEKDVNRLRTEVGMVFQRFNLFANMDVLRNLTLAPTEVLKESRETAESEAKHYLERVGMLDKINEKPSRLSGGQQQRVAIARALCMHPKAILFD
ncbi:MAG: ATP-binding cassette domain-containing protein, partial [Desulfovibrionaceae bacterium]|nr:ATP-binding cassette domain-containing protein [Desulfovibrionaceae bacterium]